MQQACMKWVLLWLLVSLMSLVILGGWRSQECFLHKNSPLQSLLSKPQLSDEISLTLQGRKCVLENLLPKATCAKRWSNHLPVSISASHLNPQQGVKKESYPNPSGQGIPKGTPLEARQGYSDEKDWHKGKQKPTPPGVLADSFSARVHQVKMQPDIPSLLNRLPRLGIILSGREKKCVLLIQIRHVLLSRGVR